MSATGNKNTGSTAQRIAALHAWYCEAMGGSMPLNASSERAWWDWLEAGHNGPQLKRVMRYLRREIGMKRRNPGSLKLSNLLDVERFEEDLLLAGTDMDAEKRLPTLPEGEGGQAQSSKLKVQRSEAPQERRPTGEAGERAFEEFRRMKGKL